MSDQNTPPDHNSEETAGTSIFGTIIILLLLTLMTYFSFWHGSQWFYGEGIYAQ